MQQRTRLALWIIGWILLAEGIVRIVTLGHKNPHFLNMIAPQTWGWKDVDFSEIHKEVGRGV